jgi:hypothetical protein
MTKAGMNDTAEARATGYRVSLVAQVPELRQRSSSGATGRVVIQKKVLVGVAQVIRVLGRNFRVGMQHGHSLANLSS